MQLTEKPEIRNWPATHYVYIEKTGQFQKTAPDAWQTLYKNITAISERYKILNRTTMYKTQPEMVYRAGVSTDSEPSELPKELKYIKLEGGKYACFTLTGPYSDLPEACGRVFEIIKQGTIAVRNDFFIENYANDPKTTPEDKLITEILIPIE